MDLNNTIDDVRLSTNLSEAMTNVSFFEKNTNSRRHITIKYTSNFEYKPFTPLTRSPRENSLGSIESPSKTHDATPRVMSAKDLKNIISDKLKERGIDMNFSFDIEETLPTDPPPKFDPEKVITYITQHYFWEGGRAYFVQPPSNKSPALKSTTAPEKQSVVNILDAEVELAKLQDRLLLNTIIDSKKGQSVFDRIMKSHGHKNPLDTHVSYSLQPKFPPVSSMRPSTAPNFSSNSLRVTIHETQKSTLNNTSHSAGISSKIKKIIPSATLATKLISSNNQTAETVNRPTTASTSASFFPPSPGSIYYNEDDDENDNKIRNNSKSFHASTLIKKNTSSVDSKIILNNDKKPQDKVINTTTNKTSSPKKKSLRPTTSMGQTKMIKKGIVKVALDSREGKDLLEYLKKTNNKENAQGHCVNNEGGASKGQHLMTRKSTLGSSSKSRMLNPYLLLNHPDFIPYQEDNAMIAKYIPIDSI